MATGQRIVGFDRTIRRTWLDATADWTAEVLPAPEVRSRLQRLLEGEVSGESPRGAREKTITVLMRIWPLVPRQLTPLRDDALAMLRVRHGAERLPLHWGLCMATYPFFRDIASTTGRLLGLQGIATLSQIARRTEEAWGQRSTVSRAVRRVVRSFVEWGVLTETQDRGVYSPPPRTQLRADDEVTSWLVEAGVSGSEGSARPLRTLLADPAFFPFDLHLAAPQLARSKRITIYRHGLEQELVVLNSDG